MRTLYVRLRRCSGVTLGGGHCVDAEAVGELQRAQKQAQKRAQKIVTGFG
jgi:hypothetical protein